MTARPRDYCGARSRNRIAMVSIGLDVPLPMYASCLDVDKGFSLFRIAFQEGRLIESRGMVCKGGGVF